MMLSSSGPANIAGNKVSTSIFMAARICQALICQGPGPASFLGSFLDDFQRATLPFSGRAHLEQRTYRVDRCALFADNLADVRRMDAQFINGHAFALDR